jgi:hypothetical protein
MGFLVQAQVDVHAEVTFNLQRFKALVAVALAGALALASPWLKGLYDGQAHPGTPRQLTTESPAAGARVGRSWDVRGTARLAPGDELWTFVLDPSVGRYYPTSNGPISVRPDGTWSCLVIVGTQQDGARLGVYAAIVDRPDQQRALRDMLAAARETHWFPGLSRLPPLVKTSLSKVVVNA